MAKKKTLKSTNLPEPQSRNEALLQNILGADYDLGEPRSRNEALLMQIAEKIGQLSEPYTAGQYININDKEISSTLHAGENVTIDEDGKINAAGGGSAEIIDVGVAIWTDGTTISQIRWFLRSIGGKYYFDDIYRKIVAGEKIILRFFDIRGRYTAENPANGVFLSQYEITDGNTNLPPISGIFNPRNENTTDYHMIALSMKPATYSMNRREREITIGIGNINYKILS